MIEFEFSNVMNSVIAKAIQSSIEKSVFCRLVTASKNGTPNVSPRETWLCGGDDRIWVAHIASPNTVTNIREYPQVCLSFIDVLAHKGYMIVGEARILEIGDEAFEKLTAYIGQKFLILSVVAISAESASPITAPSYSLFPDTTESEIVEQAPKTYGLGRAKGITDRLYGV